MLKRLGCTCCEAEDSYNLERNPVYDPKKREPEQELKYVDNKALEAENNPREERINLENHPPTPGANFTAALLDSDTCNRNSKAVAEEIKETVLPEALPDIVGGTREETTRSPTVWVQQVADQTSFENKDPVIDTKESAIQTKEFAIQTKEFTINIEESAAINQESNIENKNTESKELDLLESDQKTEKMANNIVPSITKPAPDFRGQAVVKGTFKEISLSDYKGKYLVFFFYPLDFTFVCPTEIIAFSDRAEEFRNINCEVVACSTDSHFCHLAWVNMPRKQGGLGDMKIPLLADKNCSIAKSYGVYKEDEGVTFRGLFIIDDKGNLRQVTINDLPVGRSVDETLRLVQAFQFTDKHGEVCPAGWKPGQDTMKPDPKGSKEYFGKKN